MLLKKMNSRKGFSLVELLVAGAIVTATVTSIFSILSMGSKLAREAALERRAYQALEKILESKTFSNDAIFDCHADTTLLEDSNFVLDRFKDGSSIKAQATVELFSIQYSGNGMDAIPAKKMRAILTYPDMTVGTAACTLETLAARNVEIN